MRHTLRQIWALFAPTEQRTAMWMLALIVIMAVAETAGVLSIAPFLSVLARPGIVQENHWLRSIFEATGAHSNTAFIMGLGMTTMTIVVISSTFKTLTFHLVGRFVHMQRHRLSTRLLSTYLRQPYEFFLDRNPSELAKNVLSEVDQLVFELLQPISQLIAQGTVVVAMVLLVVLYDPFMAAGIVMVIASLYGAIYLMVRRRLARVGTAWQAANTERYKSCNEAFGGIKDVKVTDSATVWIRTFARASHEVSRHAATAETLSQSPLYIVEAVGYSGLIVVALILLLRSDDVAKVLPALGMYGFAAYRLLPAVQIMYRGFARMRYSSAALQSIHSDLELPIAGTDQTADRSITPTREIRLAGIDFAYPSSPDKQILKGLNIVIPANSSVGIVGRSGAGKSTLMDILLGLLQPQSGTLSVDGIAISTRNIKAWQRSIGYVPQQIYLADATVAENIAFGVDKSLIDMAAVERAARAAQIHEFVANDLPQKYATHVGDRGVRLSGGQRQRVGIARALYHDPPVLCMDEATSALDGETEAALIEAIQRLSKRKTVIVIAHREASLVGCDSIITAGKP